MGRAFSPHGFVISNTQPAGLGCYKNGPLALPAHSKQWPPKLFEDGFLGFDGPAEHLKIQAVSQAGFCRETFRVTRHGFCFCWQARS